MRLRTRIELGIMRAQILALKAIYLWKIAPTVMAQVKATHETLNKLVNEPWLPPWRN